jgi:voltage-gated potassium channel
MNRLQKIIRAIFISWILFFIGVMGYMVIEKWKLKNHSTMALLGRNT